ncbi:MAG: winged helix-turn-helix domain-containing protein, partial [Acidobacteria bacterium]|nr:winged helix-turn-helix domain-containing protein [Acidobacteriota bacterium]
MQDQKPSLVAPTAGSPKGTFAFGPFRFDRSNGVLSSNGVEFPLQPRVLRVLEHLLERPGEVVSKQELLDAVWPDTVVAETSLIEAIKILRHALGDDPQQPTYIQTVHRRGYRFIAPVSAEPAILGGETVPGRLSPGRRYRLIGLGAAAAAVLVVGTFLLWSWASREGLESSGSNGVASAVGSETALPFEERDWVLIAAFENRTGETLFDGTLEHALGSELSNSRFVNVVPGERIADTLRLMRKPADAP